MNVLGEEGEVKLLMGNEAIARGTIEAGASLATGYPGTPSTEVIETLIPVAKNVKMKVQWAVNEKVAAEVASGVAFAGLRALVTMKNVGLNVASDSVLSIGYSGVDGGLVIYVADDPSAHAGSVEQDNRLFAKLSLLPMLEPSDPQEAKEMTVAAFDLSEEFKVPFLVRGTTSVAHMFGNVKLGPKRKAAGIPIFSRDIRRYAKASPQWCMEQHASLIQRLKKAGRAAAKFKFNKLEMAKNDKIGVIASGAAWNYLKEALIKYGLKGIAVLKIGVVNPLPDDLIEKMLLKVNSVLILEELEPIIESRVLEIIAKLGKKIEVHGKLDEITSTVGELDQNKVDEALSKVIKKRLLTPITPKRKKLIEKAKNLAVRRPLTFCSGCPHTATYIAILRALKKLGYKKEDVIVTGDIGCTILGMNPPFDVCWTEISMGASIGIASGLERSGIKKPIIAAIGDSTFYHAGMPPLVDAVWNKTNITIAILDNGTVAMTGHQPTPGSGYVATGETTKSVMVDEIARGCGVDHVVVVDPYDLKKATDAFVRALKHEGPSVIVLRRLCALVARREKLIGKPLKVDPNKCTGCMLCVKTTACAALIPSEKAEIEPESCIGCGVCEKICPPHAIGPGGDDVD